MNIQPLLDHIAAMRTELDQLQAELMEVNNQNPNAVTAPLVLLKSISNTTARIFKIDVDTILSENRSMILVSARSAIIKAARNNDISYAQIGRWLNRHHTSILHLELQYPDRIKNIPEHGELMRDVVNRF